MAPTTLRAKLEEGDFFVVPGVQDMISALLAERAGFDVVYGSGFWLTASALGLPDAGLATHTQMLDRMATLVRTSRAAVIADADTGYGGLLNVRHTVRTYEAVGVAAIQLEDQEFPKTCGHTPGKRLISLEEMVRKIEVAVDAREDALIIARTDARQGEGLDGVLRRLDAYARAGADVLLPEALASEEEVRKACASLDRPVMVNMAEGGATPMLSRAVLAELGVAFAIHPSTAALAAAAAIEAAFRALRTGDAPPPLFDFQEFCTLVGLDEVRAFDRRWAR